jgi:hypothetical protein
MTRRPEPEAAAEPLRCAACATSAPSAERFCPRCGTPLVFAPGAASPAPLLSERGERARKVKPQYSEGRLVRVATARNQSEAEFLQGMLLEEGVPSLMRRAGGFDVPDFLAAGPRDILVPASGEGAARDVLGTAAPPAGPWPAAGEGRRWTWALAVALAVLLAAVVAAAVLAATYGA